MSLSWQFMTLVLQQNIQYCQFYSDICNQNLTLYNQYLFFSFILLYYPAVIILLLLSCISFILYFTMIMPRFVWKLYNWILCRCIYFYDNPFQSQSFLDLFSIRLLFSHWMDRNIGAKASIFQVKFSQTFSQTFYSPRLFTSSRNFAIGYCSGQYL